jgi:predicted permease
MRVPLLRGRAFEEADDESSQRVAIVNQTFAEKFWPGQDPIGKRFAMRAGDTPWRVVGVAGNGKYWVVFEPALPYFYVPLDQFPMSRRVLQVRSAVRAEALGPIVTREVRALAPDMPVADLQTMRQSLNGGMGFLMFRLGASIAAAMGLLGLALAVVGVYGVVSYGASQRTREIGIRVALGSTRGQVLWLVLGQAVRLVAIGVVLGLGVTVAVIRLVGSVLAFVSAIDPLTFAGVTLLLTSIALVACYIPARRAMRVDPMVALRCE